MIFVVDAAAVLNDDNFSFQAGNSYLITNKVLSELKDMRSRSLADGAIKTGFLSVRDPKGEFIEKASGSARRSGTRLSEADLSVVALSLELRAAKKIFVVLTDDYSVQNALMHERIRFEGTAHPGISGKRVFGR